MPFLDPKGSRRNAPIRDFTTLLTPDPTARQQGTEDTHPSSTRAGTWSSEHLTCSFNQHSFGGDYTADSGGSLRNNSPSGRQHAWFLWARSRTNLSYASSCCSPKCPKRKELLLPRGNLPLEKSVQSDWQIREGGLVTSPGPDPRPISQGRK